MKICRAVVVPALLVSVPRLASWSAVEAVLPRARATSWLAVPVTVNRA